MQFFSFPIDACLPNSIASTHVELLLRNPYVYYARRILKLKSLRRFHKRPTNADFGTLVHKIIDSYTRRYENLSRKASLELLLQIAHFELSQSKANFSEFLRQKILGIAEEFVDFDQRRREHFPHVWSEQSGQTKLDISGKSITLTAIADRIELSEDNRKLSILDYKTGSIPTIKDVESGLSPQLLVSAIIAQEGGFHCLARSLCPGILVYVKLASFSPYWSIREIKIKEEELFRHKEGLRSLLSFFELHDSISISPAPSAYADYDEYKHLSRASL